MRISRGSGRQRSLGERVTKTGRQAAIGNGPLSYAHGTDDGHCLPVTVAIQIQQCRNPQNQLNVWSLSIKLTATLARPGHKRTAPLASEFGRMWSLLQEIQLVS